MKQAEINNLLDKAAEICGSDYKAAKSMGVTPQTVSDWRYGRRNPQPEDIALIACAGGLNAEQWALRAMVAKHEGTAKGDRLMKAVGKALLATGGVIASGTASAHQIFSIVEGLPPAGQWMAYFIQCILC